MTEVDLCKGGDQVRVRFLSNMGRDYYVQVLEYDNDDIKINQDIVYESDSQKRLQKNVEREREIFLKAALQLLDLHDCSAYGKPSHLQSNQPAKYHGKDIFQQIGSTTHHPHNYQGSTNHHDDNNRYDVIRLGFLKKARNSAFGGTGHNHWKRKYVELRHGLMTYDDHPSAAMVTIDDLTMSDQSNLATRRSLPLSVDHTICRIHENSFHQDNCIFEIVIDNGQKRLWMASSPSECQEWIRAIHSAMLGSSILKPIIAANILCSIAGNDIDASLSFQSHQSDNNSRGNSGNNISKNDSKEGGSKLKHIDSQQDVCNNQEHRNTLKWLSIDGAAAPYAHNMSQFLQLQHDFSSPIVTESSYRQLLNTMFTERIEITIPVLFIKSKTTHANFILSPQDSLNKQNVNANCTSQVWKDLQRDIIVVNGDLISGELGAEAMVGALVRHISEKVEELKRNKEQDCPEVEKHEMPSKLELFSPQAIKYSMQNIEEIQCKNPFTVPFAVSEAHIVQSARDLLVLCNRTQSGGDTYFCVDALLRGGDVSTDLSILTPFSPEADPLHFKVDVVKISPVQANNSVASSPSRKRGAVTDQKIVNAWSSKLRTQGTDLNRNVGADDESENQRPDPEQIDDYSIKYGTVSSISAAVKTSITKNIVSNNVTENFAVSDKSFLSPSHRRPQLDLRSELEKDGFFVGVKPRGKSSMKSDPTECSGTGTDNLFSISNAPGATSLYASSKSSTIAPPLTICHHHQPVTSFETVRPIPDQLVLRDDGKDDLSIISELTMETYNRNGTKPRMVVLDADFNSVSNRFNQNSLLDDHVEQPNVDDDMIDDDGHSDPDKKTIKSKGKSLMKKLGKNFKAFEGLTSPFKQRRGSHRSEVVETEGATRSRKNSSSTPVMQEEDNSSSVLKDKNGSLVPPQDELRHCIRIQVEANCKYRVCTANPTGIDKDDSWAIVTGTFYQSFYIVGDGSHLLGIADRLVTISVDECNT